MIAAAAVALAPVQLIGEAEIAVRDGRIRIGDVADLRPLPERDRAAAAGRVIAALPEGRRRLALSREAVAGLVRRAVPGLTVAPGATGEMVFLAAPAAAGEPETRPCLSLAARVAVGTTISAADAVPSPCRARARAVPLRYEPGGGAVRVLADAEAGAYLGRVRLPEASGIAAGDPLLLAASVGPVRIERPVVALQPGRPGRGLFVRTAEGEVVAAPVPEGGR